MESGIDGKVVTATRDFIPADVNPTLMRVIVSCKVKSGELTVAVESYEKNDKGDTHPPSAFVVDDDNDIVGKVAYAQLTGGRTTIEAWDAFALAKYQNVAEWDISGTAVDVMYETASDAFYQWAATVAPAVKGRAPFDAREIRAYVTGEYKSTWVLGALASDKITLVSTQDEIDQQFSQAVANEFFGYAHAKQDLHGLAPGSFFKRLLPVTIQLSNTGGQMELSIPADDPEISKVADQCAGTEWWTQTEAPSAASQPAAATPVAQTVSLEADAPALQSATGAMALENPKITKALDALFKQCGPSWEDLAPLATGERIQLPYRDLTISGITMADDDESSVIQVFFDDRENVAEISSIGDLWGEDNVSQGARETLLDDRSFRSRADGMTFLNTMRWVRLRHLNPSGDLGAWADEAKEFPARPKSAVQVIECVMKRQ
jgi:hypothetical protein